MAPLLYKWETSPPANAVRMTAEIIGLKLDYKEPDLFKLEIKSPAYLKLNPMGTVPVLIDGDFVLSESHAIMIYLLSKYGGNKKEALSLYPSDVNTRAVVNQVLFFDASIFFVRIKAVYLSSFFEGLSGPTEKHVRDLEEAYGMVEAFLSRNKYVAAEHITIADLSVSETLGAGQAILPLDGYKFPKTAKWFAAMAEESFFKKIALPNFPVLHSLIREQWKKNSAK